MLEIQQITQWMKVIGCAVAALAAALYGTMFLLHSLGRWKGFKTAWPPQKFWATFPRHYSGWIAIGLLLLVIVFVTDFVSSVGELAGKKDVPSAPRDIRTALEQVDNALKKLADSHDYLGKTIEGLQNSMIEVLVESHRTAVKEGKRDAWRKDIMEESREEVRALFEVFPRIEEHLTKVDLLYCLQELTGVDLALSPDQDLSPDALAAKFATAQRKYNALKPKPPASGPSNAALPSQHDVRSPSLLADFSACAASGNSSVGTSLTLKSP